MKDSIRSATVAGCEARLEVLATHSSENSPNLMLKPCQLHSDCYCYYYYRVRPVLAAVNQCSTRMAQMSNSAVLPM